MPRGRNVAQPVFPLDVAVPERAGWNELPGSIDDLAHMSSKSANTARRPVPRPRYAHSTKNSLIRKSMPDPTWGEGAWLTSAKPTRWPDSTRSRGWSVSSCSQLGR